ncbi:hypothetical protein C8J56DRAFT_926344 [Mycena floridula]|nr:hypothetical protein C8J56DRAFT_926344 [Mycena floridula]
MGVIRDRQITGRDGKGGSGDCGRGGRGGHGRDRGGGRGKNSHQAGFDNDESDGRRPHSRPNPPLTSSATETSTSTSASSTSTDSTQFQTTSLATGVALSSTTADSAVAANTAASSLSSQNVPQIVTKVGLIAGGTVFGCLVLILLIFFGIRFYKRRRQSPIVPLTYAGQQDNRARTPRPIAPIDRYTMRTEYTLRTTSMASRQQGDRQRDQQEDTIRDSRWDQRQSERSVDPLAMNQFVALDRDMGGRF